MKWGKTIIAVAAIVLFTASMTFAQEEAKEEKAVKKELTAQTVCPVMGGKINKELYADYQGQRVYFCCQGCFEPFKKSPEKYLAKAAKEGILFENVQTACPVSGAPINKEFFTYHKGRGVYFCCGDCKAAFEKEPEKYLKKLDVSKKEEKKEAKEEKHDHKH